MDSLDYKECTGQPYVVRRGPKFAENYDRIFGKKGEPKVIEEKSGTELFNDSDVWGLGNCTSKPALEERAEILGIQLSIIGNGVRSVEMLQADLETTGLKMALIGPLYDEMQRTYERLAMEKQALINKISAFGEGA